MKTELTQARLRELFSYDPETGVLRWRVALTNRCPAGSVAGTTDIQGYQRLKIFGVCWRAHRLIWMHVYGEWPRGQIDHIDGDPLNNRIKNLRDCTNAENQQNKRRAMGRSRTGLLGVTQSTQRSGHIRWRAAITIDGRRKNLGAFDSPELAHSAYVAAKRELHAFCTI